MPFDDFRFVFLFLPCLLGLWFGLLAIPGTRRKWLLGAVLWAISAYFYWWGSPGFFLPLLALTAFNFALGHYLRDHPRSKIYWFGMAVDIAVLGYFKYANFTVKTLDLFGAHIPAAMVALPIGISFFTFQKLAYLTDIRRGEHQRWKGGEFFLLVWFFPQLIAGPIVRPHEFIPQWRAMRFGKRTMWVNLAVGLTLFMVGLIKKLAIADIAAPYGDLVFGQAAAGVAPKLTDAWIGALAFTVRIYFDFSAYSDMAIGLARILGFKLPINFFSPYRSASIVEFWHRWHITLSRFLRDYIYIPLGGNRLGQTRRYVNLMAVMLIGGLWHGANWTFVAWGGLHGFYLAFNHMWRSAGATLPRWLGWSVTMLAVIFAWVAFRAPDFHSAWLVWKGMIGASGIVVPPGRLAEHLARLWPGHVEIRSPFNVYTQLQGRLYAMVIPAGLLITWLLPNIYQWLDRFEPALYYERCARGERMKLGWRPAIPFAIGLAALVLLVVFSAGKPQTYLYWQF
jgi:D-alanyl-lipoteichoic acid acyltransferase DltB (MBOAT superfamily)